MKYLLFGSLYFSEGVMMSIAFVIIPVYFVEKGISIEIAGLVIGIISIPVTIKFIWGGIVDYFLRFGRKWFIVFGGMILAICMFSLIFFNPTDGWIIFTFLLFFGVCGIGFLDVSSDAWAIEIGHEEERGKINGSMFAGQYSGLAFGSSFLALVASNYGYNMSFIFAGIIFLIILLFPLAISETKTTVKKHKIGKILINEFKKKQTQIRTILTPLLWINRGLLLLVVPLYMKVILNLEIAQIGIIVAIFPITSAVGSIISGAIADRLPRKRTMFILVIFNVILSASFIFANTWIILAVIYSIYGFLLGGAVTVNSSMLMDITNPKVGASQFSIMTSIGNTGMLTGEIISGKLISIFGFTGAFLYSAWILFPAIIVLNFVKTRNK
jgi:MFS family permease